MPPGVAGRAVGTGRTGECNGGHPEGASRGPRDTRGEGLGRPGDRATGHAHGAGRPVRRSNGPPAPGRHRPGPGNGAPRTAGAILAPADGRDLPAGLGQALRGAHHRARTPTVPPAQRRRPAGARPGPPADPPLVGKGPARPAESRRRTSRALSCTAAGRRPPKPCGARGARRRRAHAPRRLVEAMRWKAMRWRVSTRAPGRSCLRATAPGTRWPNGSASGPPTAPGPLGRGRRSRRHGQRGRRPGRPDHPWTPGSRGGAWATVLRRHAAPKSGRVRVPSSARVKPGLWAISQGWPSGSVNVPA